MIAHETLWGVMSPAGGEQVNEPTATELSSEARPPESNDTKDTNDTNGLANPNGAANTAVAPASSHVPHVSEPASRRRTKPPKAPKSPAGDAPSDADLTPTRKRRRISRFADSGRMPALRLNGYVGRERAEPKPTVVYDTEHAPEHLRLIRLLLGLALLAVAWVTTLLVVALSESLWSGFPHQPSLTERFALYLLGAVGILWLAIVALALILVGALSLSLALTRRGW